MTGEDLRHTVEVTAEADVLRAREAARTVALGLGSTDMAATRLTTCVGSLAHDLAVAGGGRVDLLAVRGEALRVRCSPAASAAGPARVNEPVSWAASAPAVALLVDRTSLGDDEDESAVGFTVDDVVNSLEPAEAADLLRRLAEPSRATWADHLHEQGRDLMMALAQVQSRDTNQRERVEAESTDGADSIIGLYHELSEELERTNQGVVALYAELDDKSRLLREASEAKSRFMRSISHELRSPSNSIIGLARLLLDPGAQWQLVEEQRDQVAFIEASARDLLSLVDELLDLAAAESGRVGATVEEVDVAALFEELTGVTRPLLRAGVTLHVHPPEPGTVLHTDPTLLRHVMRNLLSNAAKFTVEGHVELQARTSLDAVVIEVADTGIGIAEEDRAKVFEEFFQARSPLHAAVKGTGLGLAFAQRIATTLGGSLELASAPDAGSRFSVRLPREPSRAPTDGGGPA